MKILELKQIIYIIIYRMSKLKLSDRFKNGLKQYNLTIDDLNDNYMYCGGNHQQYRINRFKKIFKNNQPFPPWKNHCVCGQKLRVANCYICNLKGDYNSIIIIGSCCIDEFVDKSQRCEDCGEHHKNIKVNRCNDCREFKCDTCNYPLEEKYCLNCKYNGIKCIKCNKFALVSEDKLCISCTPKQCGRCKRDIQQKYTYCYQCNVIIIQNNKIFVNFD